MLSTIINRFRIPDQVRDDAAEGFFPVVSLLNIEL